MRWAREELNLRPLPCQQTAGKRCADGRFPGRRRPSRAKLCVLLTRSSADRQRERKAPGAGAGAPIGEDRVVGPVDLGSAPEVKADTLALSSSPKADSDGRARCTTNMPD